MDWIFNSLTPAVAAVVGMGRRSTILRVLRRLLLPALTLLGLRAFTSDPREVDRLLRNSREICRILGALLATLVVLRRREGSRSILSSVFVGLTCGILSSALSAEVPSFLLFLGGAFAPNRHELTQKLASVDDGRSNRMDV